MTAQRIVVIGSGPSGVHFAFSLLERGHRVTMVDVGRTGKPSAAPDSTLNGLKKDLPDPSEYFLGDDFRAVMLPRDESEFYGIPPHKGYIFEQNSGLGVNSNGFSPLFSFARGGFAEAWTAGAYPLNDQELVQFPFGEKELLPCYEEVAKRIGVSGEDDDLARFMPFHNHLLPPLRLDEHSRRLLDAYGLRREKMHSMGCYMGRTRVATLSRNLGTRRACDYKGRCLWGCPNESLYTPSMTLRECQNYPEFKYMRGIEAIRFRVRGGRAVSLIVKQIDGGNEHEVRIEDALALAAGTLGSARIILNTFYYEGGSAPRLDGLMDNRQILVPFITTSLIGRKYSSETYQYHLLGIGMPSDKIADYVHGQVTTLKTALLHPIVQRLPFDLRAAAEVVRAAHAGLGIVNLNFRDTRRPDNYVTLDTSDDKRPPKLLIQYSPDSDESPRLKTALGRLKGFLRKLGCFVPPMMIHVRPMGASVHYAGVLPMSVEKKSLTTDSYGRSHDFDNVFLVDGATFPFLPAKNLTFTLMANATRIAREAF